MTFNSLLIDFAKIVQTEVGDWVEPTDSVQDAIPCRIMYISERMKDFRGEEVLSLAKLFFKPEHITFEHEDHIQLDDEDYAVNHPIIKINKPQDSVQIHHAEVWIK